MGDLSHTVNAAGTPIRLDPPPFFRDHHVNARPVLAAVEAMERLAADARRRHPDIDYRRLTDIRFPKFLHLDAQTAVEASLRIDPQSGGALRSTLTTRFRSPGAAISRRLEHAALTVGGSSPTAAAPPLDIAACLTGICSAVDPQRIYEQMVPFGPAYRNIHRLLVSPDGALARVGSPADRREGLCLGSPYVLDAAFHAACVWCQRQLGIVAFPVAMDRRSVIAPTRMDATYTARVLPVQTDREPFEFDIFIIDDGGGLREAVAGLQMRDVSGGRTKPPAGFWRPQAADPLAAWRPDLTGLVLVERDALAPCAAAALSLNETRRMQAMTPRRTRGYLSARLALKRLSRVLSAGRPEGAACRPAHAIETIAADNRSPLCAPFDGSSTHCAVSHDRRFTVAVAADRRVGVDVEQASPRLLEGMHLYMHADEQALVERLEMGRTQGALRVWSAKEAAAKALGVDLAQAWERARISAVDTDGSRLQDRASNRTWPVRHVVLDDHLFTLLTMDGTP